MARTPRAKKEPVKVLDTITLEGYEVAFAYIDKKREPSFRGQEASYQLSIRLNQQQVEELEERFEPFNLIIDEMYPNTERNDPFRPDKKNEGQFILNFTNQFEIGLWDANNNKIEENINVPRGSKVNIVFGVLPFEFEGEHGISMSRLYHVQIIEMGEDKRNSPFGASKGDRLITGKKSGSRHEDDDQDDDDVRGNTRSARRPPSRESKEELSTEGRSFRRPPRRNTEAQEQDPDI